MKISPITFRTYAKQDFNGIKKWAYQENTDDQGAGIFGCRDYYNYYPFLDESKETIAENTKSESKYESHPYPAYDQSYESETKIKDTLPITTKQYQKLKNIGFDDDLILTFLNRK